MTESYSSTFRKTNQPQVAAIATWGSCYPVLGFPGLISAGPSNPQGRWPFFAPRRGAAQHCIRGGTWRKLESRPAGALCWRQIRSSSDLGVICATGTPYRDRPCGTKRRHRMGEVPRRFGRSLRASTVESRNSWGGHAQQTVIAFGTQPVAQRDRPKRLMAGSGGVDESPSLGKYQHHKSLSLQDLRNRRADANFLLRDRVVLLSLDERLSPKRLP